MIKISNVRSVNAFEKEITLTDGNLTQTYSIYFEASPIPLLTWDQGFCAQFDWRPMERKPLLRAILENFCSGAAIDMGIVMEGQLEEIGNQPGKGPGWIWYKADEGKV